MAQRSRPARLVGLLVSAAVGTGALLLVLAAQDEPPEMALVAQRSERAGTDAPAWEPLEPALPPPLPVGRPAEPLASPALAAEASALDERIERTLARMAATLRDGPLDRSSWETEVRALAGSLGEASIPRLLALAADGSLPDEELVAAAELLRPWSARKGGLPVPLPEAALAALRRSLDERPRPPAATAAARALGALGARADTARLLDELIEPASRSLASWGLQASPSVAVLDDLRGVLATGIDAESRLALLATMEGWARATDSELVAGASREAAAASVATVLDEALEPALRQRAASALAALGGASARGALERIVRDPTSDDALLRVVIPALARDADPGAIALLEDGLWNETTPGTRRLAFAEGLARLPAPTSTRPALLELAASERPAERRRALYALGTLAPGPDVVVAAESALRAADPAVRAAGQWALERVDAQAGAAR